jgi:hypothetical protein
MDALIFETASRNVVHELARRGLIAKNAEESETVKVKNENQPRMNTDF